MKRHWLAMAASICALAVAPGTALAGDLGSGSQQVDQSQSASNSNSTSQSAESEAESEQTNVNVPIAVNSPGSNNGDVNQSNSAENNASSANHNSTEQGNGQNQGAAATGVSVGDHKGPWDGKQPSGSNGGQQVHQTKSASNENSTDQSASSEA